MAPEPVMKAFEAVDSGFRFDEAGGAYGDGGSSGIKEFESILPGMDATHGEDGQMYRLGGLIDAGEGDGFDPDTTVTGDASFDV